MDGELRATNFSDTWTRVDDTSDPGFYVGLLAATRAQLLDNARRNPEQAFAPLALTPGLSVLDVGCGTGEYLGVMAPVIAPGAAVGVDLSATLVAHARRLAAGTSANLSFQEGNAYDLPFPAGSFDRVLATQVLLHLDDPWLAVSEMRRVLRPAGRLWVGEWDWDSICLAVTDRDLGRRFTHVLCDQMRNGLIVRELPAQLARIGFPDVTITPEVRLSREIDAAYDWLVEPVTRELVRSGAFSEDEGTRFLADLAERSRSGRYFLARTYYPVVAVC